MKMGNECHIALLTDMGLADWYVGTMKGVARSICPSVKLVDICHNLTKQSVEEGAFVLNVSHRYFPKGTVFLCVVDPNVGSSREPIIARNEDYYFVAPNNGLLTFVANQSQKWETRIIANPAYRLEDMSQTFHGRDVFAPAAAHLLAGASFESFGPVLEKMVQLRFIDNITLDHNTLKGRVTYIDSYGNLFTNVTPGMLASHSDPTSFRLNFGHHQVRGISPHYSAVPLNHPLMYWGSSGLLEVAFNQGSATRKWAVRVGDPFTLEWS